MPSSLTQPWLCFLVKGSGDVNAWCASGRNQRAVLLSANANLLPHQRWYHGWCKRAIHIIFNFIRGMSYPNVLFVAQLESLETRLDLSRSFFQDICKPTSCLHYLVPPPRDTSVTTRLRLTTSLPRPNLRTNKYCSLINFGLHHYQPT